MKRFLGLLLVLVCLFSVAAAEYQMAPANATKMFFVATDDANVFAEFLKDNHFYAVVCMITDYIAANPDFSPYFDHGEHPNYKEYFAFVDKKNNLIQAFFADASYKFVHVAVGPWFDFIAYDDNPWSAMDVVNAISSYTFYTMTTKEFTEKWTNIQSGIEQLQLVIPGASPTSTPIPTPTPAPAIPAKKLKEKILSDKTQYSGKTISVQERGVNYDIRSDFRDAMNDFAAYYRSWIDLMRQLKERNGHYVANFQEFRLYRDAYNELVLAVKKDFSNMTLDESAYFYAVAVHLRNEMFNVLGE